MIEKKYQIRPFEESDLKTLSEIWFSASSRVHSFLGEQRLCEQRRLVEDTYLRQAETWVACNNGMPVGFIGLMGNFIGGLFVDPVIQGGGVGRALVEYAMNLKGELQLEVYADNYDAYSFYQRLGFKEISRQAEDGDGLPFEVIHMHLKLADYTAHEPLAK